MHGMSKLNTEIFIARRISSPEGGRKNVMVRIATLTVAVGMAVMIVALAVISGFKKDITEKLVGFGGHVRIVSLNSNSSFETAPVPIDTALMEEISRVETFRSVVPFAMKGGIIKTPDAIHGVVLKGFGPQEDNAFLSAALIEGALPETGDSVRRKDLLISKRISEMLMLGVDDRVEIMFISETRPVRRDRFKVCGIYSSGMDEMDKTMVFTDIRNVQRVNGWDEHTASGYEVMTTDFDRLANFTEDVFIAVFRHAERMEDPLKVEDVVSLNPNVFDWLAAHDVNAAVIIIIMMLVALLNMISAMLIILLEKTSMIGLLKALGMTNWSIQKVFIIRSLRIVFKGMAWGNAIGLAVVFLQKFTGLVRLDSGGYLISVVPVNIDWWWFVALNVGVPLIMALLLVIPALVVTRIKPDRTMRYQ